jgi:hypothetical protein
MAFGWQEAVVLVLALGALAFAIRLRRRHGKVHDCARCQRRSDRVAGADRMENSRSNGGLPTP